VLGPLTADEVDAAALLARSERVPCIAPAATGADVAGADGWTVRACFGDEEVARALADYARMTLRLERMATVVDLRSSYSLGLAEAFAREFSRLNGRIVREVSYHSGDLDVARVLDVVAELPAEGALLAGYAPDVETMIQGARAPRLADLILLGGDAWGGGTLDRAFAGRVRGAYHTRHFDPRSTDPPVVDFVQRWTAATGRPPSDVAALSYDAARALLAVLPERSDPVLLHERLLGLHDRVGVTGVLTIDPRGTAMRRTIYLEQLHEESGPSIVAKL
jgi:branched-chain amino acid transport system substrate-binding protein